MKATLHLDTYAGRTKTPVEIIKETPKRYQVRLLADCAKGRSGDILYAPKYAVTREHTPPPPPAT